jgi:hypothetical protein
MYPRKSDLRGSAPGTVLTDQQIAQMLILEAEQVRTAVSGPRLAVLFFRLRSLASSSWGLRWFVPMRIRWRKINFRVLCQYFHAQSAVVLMARRARADGVACASADAGTVGCDGSERIPAAAHAAAATSCTGSELSSKRPEEHGAGSASDAVAFSLSLSVVECFHATLFVAVDIVVAVLRTITVEPETYQEREAPQQ